MTEKEAKEEAIKLRDSFKNFASNQDVRPLGGMHMIHYSIKENEKNAKQCAIIAQKRVIASINDAMLYKQSKRDDAELILKALEEL